MLDTVTTEQWREFDAHGVVSLGVALSPAELGAISERLDAIMLGDVGDPYPFDRMLMQVEGGSQTRGHKGRTLDYRKIQGLEHDPVILSYLRSDLFRCVAERTYPGAVGIYRTMFFNKTALSDAPTGGGSQLAWHQDRWSTLDRCAILQHCWRARHPRASCCMAQAQLSVNTWRVMPPHTQRSTDHGILGY